MAGKPFLFLPGDGPGKYAAGHAMDNPIMRLTAERLRLLQIPLGDKVTERHPWMRTAQIEVVSGQPPVYVVRNAAIHDEWWALNQTGRKVHIEEVRIRVNPPLGGAWPTWWNDFLQVQMGIPPRRQVIEKWIPWKTLDTDPGRYVGSRINELTYVLPAPYFLDRTGPFAIDVQYFPGLVYQEGYMESLFDIVLQGWGVEDGEPIHLVKRVPWFPEHLQVAGAYQTIAFDDDREHTLRSAYITHIGFGGAYIGSGQQFLSDSAFVRFKEPAGKAWGDGEFFNLLDISNQTPYWTLQGVDNSAQVVHKPVTPYVLLPGEQFQMKFLIPNYWGDITKNVRVTLLGTQEVA